MADFVIADVTDSMLDGIIAGRLNIYCGAHFNFIIQTMRRAGFPNTFASKVGKTSDAMYKSCPN